MERIATIDIGSNSIILDIVEIIEKKHTIIYTEKNTIRLAEGLEKNGVISSVKMDLAINNLKKFKCICDKYNTEKVIAVATQAARIAKNKDELVEKARAIGVDIFVISGKKEAQLAYISSSRTMCFDNAVIVDIGGASTEIVYVERKRLKNSISIPYGAINLYEKFCINTIEKRTNTLALDKYYTQKLEQIEWLKNVNNISIIGMGGSIRNIAMVQMKISGINFVTTHKYVLSREQLNDIQKNTNLLSAEQLVQMYGISLQRAQIFPAALTAVNRIAKYCSASKIVVNEQGIRQGVLFDYMHGCNIL